MSEFDNFNSVFFLSFATITFAFLGIVLKYCLRSKCSDIELCGLIHIKRDVQAEIQEEMKEMELGVHNKEESKE